MSDENVARLMAAEQRAIKAAEDTIAVYEALKVALTIAEGASLSMASVLLDARRARRGIVIDDGISQTTTPPTTTTTPAPTATDAIGPGQGLGGTP